LFAKVGLKSPIGASTIVQLPAEPFVDVPWKDDDVSEDDLSINETGEFREPISILYDERYRLFEPLRQHDLLLRRVYETSFGLFLDRIKEIVIPDDKDSS
jgi:hypothetical protein